MAHQQQRRAPDFERQRALAASLPGATEDIKWGADLVYSVGGRMFCVLLLEAGRAATCSFKVDSERFLELTGVPGVIPAPYLARAKWVQLGRVHGLAGADLDALVRRYLTLADQGGLSASGATSALTLLQSARGTSGLLSLLR